MMSNRQAEVVQRLYDLVPDVHVVERTLLRFEMELKSNPSIAGMAAEQQLLRLVEILLSEKTSPKQATALSA